jgi:hypothetical protein
VEIVVAGDEGSITIPVPRTVLAGSGSLYYLWALANKRFDSEAEAFRAPFPNVYPDGRICWGTGNPVPEADAGNARAVWELFFKTPFNQDLAQGKSGEFPVDCREQLRNLSGKNTYPARDLVPTRQEIGELVGELLGVEN